MFTRRPVVQVFQAKKNEIKWDPLRKANQDYLTQVGSILGYGLREFIEAVMALEGRQITREQRCNNCRQNGHHTQECQGANPEEPELYKLVFDVREPEPIGK